MVLHWGHDWICTHHDLHDCEYLFIYSRSSRRLILLNPFSSLHSSSR